MCTHELNWNRKYRKCRGQHTLLLCAIVALKGLAVHWSVGHYELCEMWQQPQLWDSRIFVIKWKWKGGCYVSSTGNSKTARSSYQTLSQSQKKKPNQTQGNEYQNMCNELCLRLVHVSTGISLVLFSVNKVSVSVVMWNTRIWLKWKIVYCCVYLGVCQTAELDLFPLSLRIYPTHNMQHGLVAKKINLKF